MNSLSASAQKGGKLKKLTGQILKSDKLGLMIALAIIVVVFQYITGNQ